MSLPTDATGPDQLRFQLGLGGAPRARRLLGVACLVGIAGCSAVDDQAARGVEAMGEDRQAIAGGYQDEDDDAVVAMVVSDVAGAAMRACSATLIAPDLVLTAQHCVASSMKFLGCDEAAFGPPLAAARLRFATSARTDADPTTWLAAREVLVPPGSSEVCGRDVALVVLATPVPPETATPMAPSLDRGVEIGAAYSAIGYGATGSADAGPGWRRRRDGLRVTCLGEQCSSTGEVGAREWGGDHGVCAGDSGGPAIDDEGRVAGVTSRGPLGCDDPIYTAVEPWAGWLRDAGARAAADRGYPEPAWVTDLSPRDAACSSSAGANARSGWLLPIAMLWIGGRARRLGRNARSTDVPARAL